MPVASSSDAERLQAELADLQMNHALLELFLKDGEGDARVPVSLVRALSSRASQLRGEMERVRALLGDAEG